MRGGATITGKAREFVESMLSRIDLDSYLNEIGCFHKMRRFSLLQMTGKTPMVEHTFERQHREVDTTAYGNGYRSSMVTSPGLYVVLEDTADSRETKIAAALLLIEGLKCQLAGQKLAFSEQTKRLNALYGENERRGADLLVFWDRMGKKARKTFAAKYPKVAERMEALENERDDERDADADDYDW